MQIPGGVFADKYSGKATLGLGMLISSIGTIMTPLMTRAYGSAMLIVLRLIIGLAQVRTFFYIVLSLTYFIVFELQNWFYSASTLKLYNNKDFTSFDLALFFFIFILNKNFKISVSNVLVLQPILFAEYSLKKTLGPDSVREHIYELILLNVVLSNLLKSKRLFILKIHSI